MDRRENEYVISWMNKLLKDWLTDWLNEWMDEFMNALD